MKIKTKEIDKWNNWTRALSEIVEKCTFKVTPNGITQRAKDIAKICLLRMKFNKDCFEEFSTNKGKEYITVDSSSLSKIIDRGRKSDWIEMKTNEDEGELIIKYNDGNEKEYRLPLLTKVTEESKDLSKLKFTSTVKLDPRNLIDEFKNVSLFSDRIRFELDKKNGELNIESVEAQGGYNSTYDKDNTDYISIKEDSNTVINMDMMEEIVKSIKGEDNITVKFVDEAPLMVLSKDDNSELKFYNAPIIERD